MLPFKVISGNEEIVSLAEGLHEDIINSLTKQTAIAVVSRLGVDSATSTDLERADFRLEGSVRAAGERLRLSFALFDAASQSQAWSERYDRVIDDIFVVQSEIAVVMEPTDLKLELGCNGSMNADVIFRGRAAHSARPWLGDNAVSKAGQWLAAMHVLQPRSEVIAGLEYREVFTVTRAHGGIANNIVRWMPTVDVTYVNPGIFAFMYFLGLPAVKHLGLLGGRPSSRVFPRAYASNHWFGCDDSPVNRCQTFD